jgi:hypothetical protein
MAAAAFQLFDGELPLEFCRLHFERHQLFRLRKNNRKLAEQLLGLRADTSTRSGKRTVK